MLVLWLLTKVRRSRTLQIIPYKNIKYMLNFNILVKDREYTNEVQSTGWNHVTNFGRNAAQPGRVYSENWSHHLMMWQVLNLSNNIRRKETKPLKPFVQ